MTLADEDTGYKLIMTNIARGTTDPGIASIIRIISPATKQANSLERKKNQVKHSIASNFGHQVESLALSRCLGMPCGIIS